MNEWLVNLITNETFIVSVLTILAIFWSPLVALKVQKKIEASREETQRKLDIFKTLMATRADPASLYHVQALNMIDIEYYNNKPIKDFWNLYRDHLNSYPQKQYGQTQESFEQDQRNWEEKRKDYFTDLLYSMAQLFNYDFDKVVLKKGAYSPTAHGILNEELNLIRRGLIQLLYGQNAINVHFFPPKQETKDENLS